jgi:hypothetical protein
MKYKKFFKKYVIENFEKYLNDFVGKPNLNFLQIGAYAGDASIWLSSNILTDLSSKLYDIDTWNENDKLWGGFNLEEKYDKKTKKYPNVIKHKLLSDSFFKTNNIFFDFVYIDGSIEKNQTYKDIKNSFMFLKNNGLIIVDDYEYFNKKNKYKTSGVRQFDVDKFILENETIIYKKNINGQMLLKRVNNE